MGVARVYDGHLIVRAACPFRSALPPANAMHTQCARSTRASPLPSEGRLAVATQREQPLVILFRQLLAWRGMGGIGSALHGASHGALRCMVHHAASVSVWQKVSQSAGSTFLNTDAAHECLELCGAADPAVVRPVYGHGSEGGLHGWP